MRRDTLDLRIMLRQLASEQAGFFSASQALQIGYSYQAQRYHVQRGDWIRVERGIFRLAGWPESQFSDLVRWSLWSRDRAVVSHQTALAVHDLGDVMPARVHLTVPPDFRPKASGVILHRGELTARDIEKRLGFRVTTPERSLVDTAASPIEIDHMATAIQDALDRGLTTTRQLRTRADEVGPEAAVTIERALRELDL